MKTYSSYIVAAILLVILGVLPLFLPSYYVGLLSLMLIYGIFAMSLDILVGYIGLMSLGHAASFGASAYTVGILNLGAFQNFPLELVAGLTAATVVAAAFGVMALRGKGIYLMMITFSLSMVLWALSSKWVRVTNGSDGLPGISRPSLSPIPWELGITSNFYYFILIFFIVAVILMYLIVRSPFGLALIGIRESETRMSCLGYNTWRYKYIAFIVAGVFAGLAGILFVYYNRYVSPFVFDLVVSAEAFLMVILGGAGTLFGPVIGAGVITFLKNFISAYTQRWLLVLGAIYVLVILFAPHGIYGPIKQFMKRWLRL